MLEYDIVSLLFDRFWYNYEKFYSHTCRDVEIYVVGLMGQFNVILSRRNSLLRLAPNLNIF